MIVSEKVFNIQYKKCIGSNDNWKQPLCVSKTNGENTRINIFSAFESRGGQRRRSTRKI